MYFFCKRDYLHAIVGMLFHILVYIINTKKKH